MIFIFLCYTYSCKESDEDFDVCLDYDKDIQKDAIILSNNPVELPDDYIYAEKFWMISDTMLAISNRREAGNFLDIVNPVDGKIYSSLLKYGEGPDEMIMCGLYYDGQYFTAVDYARSRYAKFTPHEASRPEFKPRYIDYPREIGVTSPPICIGDTTYIVNPYHYINKSNDIIQDVERFLIITENDLDPINIERELLYTQNVDQVVPLADEINGHIWLLRRERSIIDIYNYNTEKIKSVKIKDELDRDPDVIVDDRSVIYYAGYPSAYLNAIIDYDYNEIITVYCGKLETPDMVEKTPSKIIVFDIDGNFKRAYACGSYICSLSKATDGIYATIYDDEAMPLFVKLE